MATQKFPRHLPKYKALTKEIAVRVFDYFPKTGILRWKKRSDRDKSWNTRYAGKIAGCPTRKGYLHISLKITDLENRHYFVHHIAWLIMTGDYPTNEIDHRNKRKVDNRWKNLREATTAQNQQYQGIGRNNTSGYKGVSYDSARSCWAASILCNGKRFHIGRFDTAKEAYRAYKKKAKELHKEFFHP